METTRDPVHLKGTPASSPQELRASKGEIVTERLGAVRLVDPAVLAFLYLQERGVLQLVRRPAPPSDQPDH